MTLMVKTRNVLLFLPNVLLCPAKDFHSLVLSPPIFFEAHSRSLTAFALSPC